MHSLALRMGRTVSELSATMTMDEFARWVAINRESPVGDERFDLLFANLCSTVVSASGAKKRGGGAFTLRDFMMFARKADKEATPLEFLQRLVGHRVVQRKREKD